MTIRRALGDGEAKETKLAGEVINEPWRDYRFGQGIDAQTGRLATQAVEPFVVDHFGSYDVVWNYAKISSESEYEQLFSAELSGSYNTDGIKASGSAEFLSHVSYSSTSMTLVILYDIESNGYGTPSPAPSLTPAAKKVAQDPPGFRNVYGDYFVANMTSGARFAATYTCSASNSSSLIDFKASAEVSSDAVTAKGAVAFEQKAKASNISVSCKVFMHGINKIHPPFGTSPAAMAEAFAWFAKADDKGQPVNLSFIPRRALFTHYSQLDPNLPRTLPVDPGVFSEIQSLAYLVNQVITLFDKLPDYYKTLPYPGGGTYGERVKFLEHDFENSQGTFPEHPERMRPLIELGNQLLAFIRSPLSLFSFYTALTGANRPEGQSGDWTYTSGYKSSPSGISIPVSTAVSTYYRVWEIAKTQEHTFQWPWEGFDANQIVVGWTINNEWDDELNGKWWLDNRLIGRSSGSVKIQGKENRGIYWSLTVYYVDKSQFPWLGSGVEEHEPEHALASQP